MVTRKEREEKQRKRLDPLIERIQPLITQPEKPKITEIPQKPLRADIPLPEEEEPKKPQVEILKGGSAELRDIERAKGRAERGEPPTLIHVSVEEIRQRRQEIQQRQLLAQQLQQQGFSPEQIEDQLSTLTPLQGFDLQQALGQGITEAAIGGAGLAAAGAVVSGGAGAIPAGILGVAGGFIRGFYSNLKKQKTGKISAEALNVRRATRNLNMIIANMNAGVDPVEARANWNFQLARLSEAHSNLKRETSGGKGLLSFLGDGTKELEEFEIFYSFILPQLELRFDQAVVNPNPNKISATAMEYMEEEDLNNIEF